MEIEVVTRFEDFLSLEHVWNNLLEKSPQDSVFLRHEWFRCWWLGFGKDKQLFIILVKDNDKVIGIAPLMVSSSRYRGIPIKQLGFIENDNSPRVDFILTEKKQEIIEIIIKYFKKHENEWNMIYLRNLPENSFSYEILEKVSRENDRLFGIKKGLNSPFIHINFDWDTYFQTRSVKFHKVLRNKINRMQRLGSYTIQKFERIENNGKPLTEIFEISQDSWKAKFQKDITTNRDNKTFFEELSRIAGDKGWLKIWLLTLDNKPIAYEYHLKYKDREYGLRADFDEKYRNSHPGSVLDAHIMQDIFKNKLKEYDMGGSNDLYKRNWTSLVKSHSHFSIFNHNLKSVFIYILEYKIIAGIKKFINPVRQNYTKAYKIYKSQGIGRLTERVIKKILGSVFTTNSAIWFERDISQPIEDFKAKIPVEISLFSNDETLKWLRQEDRAWMMDSHEIKLGLKQGHYFPNVKYKGGIIGCIKVGFNEVYIADYKKTVFFPENMAFHTDIYIIPEHRELGIASYLLTEVMKLLKEKGFTKIRCHIPPWNVASIKIHKKIGFKYFKHIWFFKIFGLKFLTANPMGHKR